MRAIGVALGLALVAPAVAAEPCPMERAVYADTQSGFELRFRAAQSWETTGMTTHVFELAFPDGGTVLWGRIGSNMGISRNVVTTYDGCPEPTRDGPRTSDAALAACVVSEGVAYALGDGTAALLPHAGEPAAPVLLISDIGRQLRYSGLVLSPGDEPWDVFVLKGCVP